jgi:hypothetical protein
MKHTIESYLALLEKTSLQNEFPAFESYARECRYRTRVTERMCPVGLLIPNVSYTNQMEKKVAEHLFDEWPQLVEEIIPEGMTVYDLTNIQHVHDDIATRSGRCGWPHEEFMKRIRKIFDLIILRLKETANDRQGTTPATA